MNPMDAREEPVWSSSRSKLTPKPLSVSMVVSLPEGPFSNVLTAKFTGYQYGGRPLGLSFVKYTNQGSGDAMEGTEATGGLTQDQIM